MTAIQMKDMFDLLYNNSASAAVSPLSTYEISLYLTKAQLELVKNKIELLGNKYQQSVEGSNKRELDLQSLVVYESITTVDPNVDPKSSDKYFSDNAITFNTKFVDALKILNYEVSDGTNKYQGIPLAFTEIERKLSGAYPYPLKGQAWLIRVNENQFECIFPVKIVQQTLINDANCTLYARYIKRPTPIIVGNLGTSYDGTNLYIDGISSQTDCKLDPLIHDEIVHRAVEIAKGTYSYDEAGNVQFNNMVQLGNRTE